MKRLILIRNVILTLLVLAASSCSNADALHARGPAAQESEMTTITKDAGSIPAKSTEGGSSQQENDVDSGFRTPVDGFSFENFGNDAGITNLTPVEMERMFGEQVCASKSQDKCNLTPPARAWMKEFNRLMAGGHCEGIAVLSSLIFYGKVTPGQFGAGLTSNLELGNQALQREIAYWFVTQATSPGADTVISDSPASVVQNLIKAMDEGKNEYEWWVLGMYMPDGSFGHAVTPIGVDDKGQGLYDILVYDNNFPGETRRISVDTKKNSWQYVGISSPNSPEVRYSGDKDTQNLEIVAISPRLGQQTCDFCLSSTPNLNSPHGQLVPGELTYQIYLKGNANLLVVDENGRKFGVVNGELVNQIPGASRVSIRMGTQKLMEDSDFVVRIPTGLNFTISVTGGESISPSIISLAIIGPGNFFSLNGIKLDSGETDDVKLEVSGSKHQISYATSDSEAPVMRMGMESVGNDFAFVVNEKQEVLGSPAIQTAYDLTTRKLIINSQQSSLFDVNIVRINPETGEDVFGLSDYQLPAGATIFLNYGAWGDDGADMLIELDADGDGEVEKEEIAPDKFPDSELEWDWEEELEKEKHDEEENEGEGELKERSETIGLYPLLMALMPFLWLWKRWFTAFLK